MLGEERAQNVTPEKLPLLKLPPIKTNISTVETCTNENSGSEDGAKPDGKAKRTIDIKKSLIKVSVGKKSSGKKEATEVKESEKIAKEKEESSERKSNDDSSRNNAKSPKKKSQKPKKKAKSSKENVIKGAFEETKMTSVNYEAGKNVKATMRPFNVEKEDESRVNEEVIKIMDEEKMKLKELREAITTDTLVENKQKEKRTNFNSNDFSINEMVVIQIPEQHFIPGQPCLGKIVSLPDAVGVLTVHYYSGSYEGDWKPMMSRSSPYLRRVPISRVVCKFELDHNNRMSKETIDKIKKVIEPGNI